MDVTKINSIDITKNKSLPEAEIIANIFCVHKAYINELLSYGFVYNYEKGWFITKLVINGNPHWVWIQKQVKEEFRLIRYRLSFQAYDTFKLKGSDDFNLYGDITERYNSINVEAFFNYIHNVYKLNQIIVEEKDTFKKFVENEKGSEEIE
jgi:hypothetical protein